MCIKTECLPVFTLNDINTQHRNFILIPIEQLGSACPFLEQTHRASFYTILYCQKGSGVVTVDKDVVYLKDETILCIGTNSVNSLNIKPKTKGWLIFFSEAFFSLRYNDNVLYHFRCLKDSAYNRRLSKSESAVLALYIDHIKIECAVHTKKSINILRSYLNIILSILDNTDSASEASTFRSEKDRKVITFTHLIDQHYKQYKLPSFYAKELCISVNYLNRICQEKRGMSSGDIIRQRVVIEAERLLYHTFKSISEISEELGFDSISYFTTFFKKYTGITPDYFRKMNK